jgi:hypothetical protein
MPAKTITAMALLACLSAAVEAKGHGGHSGGGHAGAGHAMTAHAKPRGGGGVHCQSTGPNGLESSNCKQKENVAADAPKEGNIGTGMR